MHPLLRAQYIVGVLHFLQKENNKGFAKRLQLNIQCRGGLDQ